MINKIQGPFTCFCDRDYCNSDKAIRRIETTTVPLITCVCKGAHCESRTCIGEMCSYVINHRTKQSEQVIFSPQPFQNLDEKQITLKITTEMRKQAK